MTTSCPSCGAPLNVELTAAVDPSAPVPQPSPAPVQLPPEPNTMSGTLGGQVYREENVRWITPPADRP